MAEEKKKIVGDKYLTISLFQGRALIHIQRFFQEGDRLFPRKEGIALRLEDLKKVKELLPWAETKAEEIELQQQQT